MGVRGLQTFLKNNPHISQKIDLADTSLVIDANNLLCYLFCNICSQIESEQCRSDIYGGDLVAYAEAVKQFFSSLDKCNITPILIFDGSVIGKKSTSSQLVLKEKTVYKRGLNRFEAVQRTTELDPSPQIILPPTINYVFKNIITDLGIQRIQAPYEADTHIARIANDLNCPVLTNDSDFLIYSLPVGFIMLDLFSYKQINQTKNVKSSIKCFVYSQNRLIKCLPGLPAQNMPLLSVLLGNDYVEAGTFDRVLENICNRPYRGALVAETWAHKRIANLLDWLKDKTQMEAIEYVLSIQTGDRNRLRNTIAVLLRNYKIEETDNFETELEAIYPQSKADPKVNIHPELMPPAYLRRLLEAEDLNPIALDIIFHNTFYNYAIIDDSSLPSSSYVKYRPISLAVALLRTNSYLGLTTYRRQVESEKDSFYLYDRIKNEYCKVKVSPMDHLAGFGSLENFTCYSMITLDCPLKKSIIMSTFHFNNDEFNLMTDTISQVFTGPFVHESSTCMMLVNYIGLETKMKPKPQFVDALLLTLFYYAALTGHLNQNVMEGPQYGSLLLKLRPFSISGNYQQGEHPQPALYRRIVHFISQLKCAYISYCLINSLLNHVFVVPRYEKFFNSTLIFRLTRLLRVGEMKLETLCRDMPILLDVCNSVKILVHTEE